ncbi:helix-turn-helix transcriptional regulator [Streptomyces sp. NPDC002209]|uniref:helix-turn-helix domain-containing protein n=1 Tax=Streptomyces sp. NPDC002209 TaxID=3364638 RepID=UPI0036904755
MSKAAANKDRENDNDDERPATSYVAEIARILRLEKKLTQVAVGEMIGYTGSAISAMETGAQPVSDNMLVGLEVAIGDRRGFFESARKYVLMEKYPVRFRKFSQVEAEALMLSSYQTMVMDGLFQTESYARAVFKGSYPPVSDARAEELVEARMARKALFDRDPVAMIELIVEEGVLERPYGSWDVQRGQLLSLAEDAQRDNVSVQVLAKRRGLKGSHAGERGPMKVVETGDHHHVVYMEINDEGLLISNPAKVSRLAQRYAKIRSQALSPDESLELIQRLAGERKK